MLRSAPELTGNLSERLIAGAATVLVAAIVILTWMGINKSRADSFKLLVSQGETITEALAKAAENAILWESHLDYIVHKRYSDLILSLGPEALIEPDTGYLMSTVRDRRILGLHIYDGEADLLAGASAVPGLREPPEYVRDEIAQLLANPETNYILLLDEPDGPGEPLHYYVEITGRLDRAILITAEAGYYVDALSETQIGYLVRDMAREEGVEYVIYQTSEGIVFSSREAGEMVSIESDPFLTDALESERVEHRLHDFQGKDILELVRPFSSTDFKFGLFRVGLSLDAYNTISRGFDIRMLIVVAAAVGVLAALLLYLRSRRRRREIDRRFRQMKTVTDRIFDQMKTGVAAFNEQGAITLANRSFESLFGLHNAVGRPWNGETLSPELSLDRLCPVDSGASESELSLSIAGKRRTLLVAASEISAVDGGGIVAAFHDITRLKEFERKSARKARLSEMGNLAAGVAHEIRNPLNSISIAAQRLALEFAPSDNKAEFEAMTSQIRSETNRLNQIITRFLALARENEPKRMMIDLGKFLQEQGKFLSIESNQLGIDLTVDCSSELSISTAPDSLKQILVNLFNNSKEALDGRPGSISISARREGTNIEIIFSDSGPGISSDVVEEVFAPYFTTKEAGTGLGLPTTLKLVNEMGGDIKLQKSAQSGAVFVITLPA